MLSDISEILNNFDPKAIENNIAQRARQLRLAQNITQEELSTHAGVSLGSLKRFERTGEVSLNNLLRLAIALNATDAFRQIFTVTVFNSVDDVLKLKKTNLRKRASKKS